MSRQVLKNIIFSALIVFTASNLRAQTIANDTTNSWLKISPSARNMGVGESLGAIPDAFDEVDVNPAGIGLMGGYDFSFSQNFWAQGLSMQHLVYSQRLENNDGFSLGVNYVNFGNISLYNVSGLVVSANGSYAPSGLNVYGGYGMDLVRGLRGGLSVHFIYDNIQPTMPDQTAAFDGGLFYQLTDTPLSLSAVLSNLGWNIDDASLPLEFKIAWAYRVNFDRTLGKNRFTQMNCLTLSAEGDWSLIAPVDSSMGFGGEYWYKDLIALRAGYRFADYANIAGLTGFSLGVGIRYMDWQLDYDLTTIGDFGTSNQISLSLILGESKGTLTTAAAVSPTPTAGVILPQTINPSGAKVSTHAQVSSKPTMAVSPTPAVVIAKRPPENEKPNIMWGIYQTGITAYRAGKYEDAAKNLKKAVICPGGKTWQYAECCALLGVINEYYVKTNDHLETARHYFLIALQLDPKNITATKHLKILKEEMSHH
jgi:hypothetical protein